MNQNSSDESDLQFPTPTEMDQFLRGYIAYITLGLWAMVGNSFLISVVLQNPKFREKLLLIAGLALGDFCFGFAAFLAGSMRLAYIHAGSYRKLQSRFECLCRPYNLLFILGYFICAGVSLLITLERFICVAAPLKFFTLPTNLYVKRSIYIAFAIAVLSTCAALPASHYSTGLVENLCFTEDGMGEEYSIYLYGVCTVGGLANVVIYLVALVALVINKRRLIENSMATYRLNMEAKVVKMMAAVILVQFVFSILPDIGLFLTVTFQYQFELLIPYFGSIHTANAGMNIFIYGFFNSELRSAFIAIFKKLKVTTNTSSVHPISLN